ncbi:MAG: futalosine hydrolase [Ferruginibacter sp.]
MMKISAKVNAIPRNIRSMHEICGMQILVMAATNFEIQPFIANNKEAEILITGVGVPATMYSLQNFLFRKNFTLVVQAGIAGSFANNIPPGEVVLVKSDTFGDIGMEEKERFVSIFESGFADKNEFPFQDGWLQNSNAIFGELILRSVKAITVNKVSDSLLQREQAISSFAPQIESMEGAALHYICLKQNIPFVQIRSISNWVGDRNKQNWKLKESISNLHQELLKLIDVVKKTTQ